MPPGFLCVFTEPGTTVGLEEFQDWYDNEHIPLRLDHIPAFLSGVRYRAADGGEPGWAALYEVEDTATFGDESYTRLRTNRSPREADLVTRLKILDRRTCEALADSGSRVGEGYTSFGTGNPTGWIVTHGLQFGVPEEQQDVAARSWAGRRTQSGGWLRTRVYKCYDSGRTGVGVGPGPEEQAVARFLVVHEFVSEATARAFDVVSTSEGEFETTEKRVWQLYRAYETIGSKGM